MKKIDVVSVIDIVEKYYPSFKYDSIDEITDDWHRFLKNADLEDVKVNLERHIKTNRFPPTMADLLVKNNGNRYIPSSKETQLLLHQGEKQIATKEFQDKALAEIKALAEGFVNKS